MKVILGHFHFCHHLNTAYDSIIDILTCFSRSVRHFHQNSPFSHDRGSWVILKFGELKNLSGVRRSFQLKFFPNNPRHVPQLKAFQRLFRCFETFGATRSLTPRGRHRGRKMSSPSTGSRDPSPVTCTCHRHRLQHHEMLKTMMWPSVRVQAARRGF